MGTIIDKLAWMRIENGKLLCVRTRGKDKFYNPGGKREGNETDEQALIREIKEELNVDIIPETIKPFDVYSAQADGKAEGVIVKMTCYSADYTGTLKASDEIAEYAWLDTSNMDVISAVGQIIFRELKSQGLIN